MPKVTFLPANKMIEVEAGAILLDVALQNDIDMEHACGGNCSCTTCRVEIRKGAEHLLPMGEDEKDTLSWQADNQPNMRLSCQTVIQGDVTVEIME